MAFHRFKIGQQVLATAFGVLTGPYEITRLLPLVAGVPYYRAKLSDGRESAFSELSLRPTPDSANRNGTEAAKSKSRVTNYNKRRPAIFRSVVAHLDDPFKCGLGGRNPTSRSVT